MSCATKTQMSYANVLKHKIAASNPQDDEPEKYDLPPAQEQKQKAIARDTDEFPTLSSDIASAESQEAVKNATAATALELKKAKEENAKTIKEAKYTMRQEMEAMKLDLTTTLRAEFKTMVTESTKAAVEDVRAEIKDCMKNEVKSLISSIDSQLSTLFQRFEATHSHTTPQPETPPFNKIGHQATGNITPDLSHDISQ
eukprot:8906846-Ditylum_brightwellii.AAC.1